MASLKLRYSPLFYKDLDKITDYILLELKNKEAAKILVKATEVAIKKRLTNPVSVTPYKSIKHRQYTYRRIIVGSYLIFYIVIDDTIIIRRMLYGRRDLDRIL